MARVIFVANSKGGVGKTTIATILAEVNRALHGSYPAMIDCDSRHKLAKIFKNNVQTIEMSASTEAIAANPDLLVSHWDCLGDSIMSGADTIIDLGANVDRSVLEWAARSKIADYLGETAIDVVVPTTAEPLAIEGAGLLLASAATVFPASRRILVLNEAAGGFDAYSANPAFCALKSVPGVMIVPLSRCTTPIWLDLERDGFSFAAAIEAGSAAVGAELGITRPWVVDRMLGDLGKWGMSVVDAFAPLYR